VTERPGGLGTAPAGDPQSRGSDATSRGWRAGLRIGTTLAASSFALAISFGVEARAHGWSPVAIVLFSLLVFSGSAQFSALTVLAGGGGTLSAVGSAALINARYLPMAAAAAGSFRGGRWRRGLEAQAVVDGTALGATLHLSTTFIDRWGLDVIFPAYFLALLVDALRSSARARLIATTSALIAASVVFVAPTGIALLSCSAAALLNLLLRNVKDTA
jgi:predicted branched-subunit amino acid permease